MICPICKTNNANHQHKGSCIQCGSDLEVHRLLRGVDNEMQMKNEIAALQQALQRKNSGLFIALQLTPSILLLICALFGIFVGMRFLTFLDHEQSHRISITDQSANTGYQQLQQMDFIIKQEFGLILAQRHENLALQAQLRELIAQLSKNSAVPPVPSQIGQ